MNEGTNAGNGSHNGATYDQLSVEKRAVVDEVVAAANTMLESLKSGRFAGRPPHLVMMPFLDQLRAFEATARSHPELAPVLENPARDAVSSMLTSFGRDAACVDRVETFLDVQPDHFDPTPVRSKGIEFSNASEDYIAGLIKRKSMSEKDVLRYQKMLALFQKVVGDRPVLSYNLSDLKKYHSVLRELPARFAAENVKVSENGELLEPLAADPSKALAVGTVASYLAPVQAVFTIVFDEANMRNPFGGLKVDKPKKNRSSRSRPLPLGIVERVILEGQLNGSLAAMLLPVVGLLTARRIGLLTFLNYEWLEKIGDHYIVRPTEAVVLPGRTARTPIKTDESMVPFVLHEDLVRVGVVDLMKTRNFLFLEMMSAKDPAAALSKRANTLLRKAGAKGRKYGQTFHGIRARGITHFREHVPQAVRLQAGHAAADEHESYDWAEIEPELVPKVANVPLPARVDLSALMSSDFKRAIALEEKLEIARIKREAEAQKKKITASRKSWTPPETGGFGSDLIH